MSEGNNTTPELGLINIGGGAFCRVKKVTVVCDITDADVVNSLVLHFAFCPVMYRGVAEVHSAVFFKGAAFSERFRRY